MARGPLAYLMLHSEITPFEERYLRRVNRIALVIAWLHVPVFALVASLVGTSVMTAIVLSAGAALGPTLAFVAFAKHPRAITYVYGISAMLMGGVLVFIGQGPLQIEMHFYFFVMIAFLVIFANPLVIVLSAVTVAMHHVVLWIAYPDAVFNTDSSLWTVVVHAVFVVFESAGACFVARTFHTNVIRLERLVGRKTAALDVRNRAMSRILDHVGQGLVTVGFDGSLGTETSRTLHRWFGEPSPEMRVWSYLAPTEPDLEAWIELGFSTLAQGVLPLDVAIAQLPTRLERGGRSYELAYSPVGTPAVSLLLVVTDVTDERARERAEGAQREMIGVVERAYRDRRGFLSFLRDAEQLVHAITTPQDDALADLKRRLHTLKGNASMFGVVSIAELCHELEDRITETRVALDPTMRARLADAWRAFHERIDRLLGLSHRRTILVDWEEYQKVLASISQPEPTWVTPIRRWGQEAARPYFERFAEQAQQLAERLGKPELEITIEDGGVMFDPDRFARVWASLIHAVRNAVDHGIESPEVRASAGKPARARLTLTARDIGDELLIAVSDDGAGIAWDHVAQRATSLGLPVLTSADLEQAMFAVGVSTADEITETSGRGVGMSAIRAACSDVGGTVEIRSVRGTGTTVCCRLPLQDGGVVRRRATHRAAELTS